jgi:thioredoxin reductase
VEEKIASGAILGDYHHVSSIREDAGQLTVVMFDGGEYNAACVVFAPAGTEVAPDSDTAALFGVGVSVDASSDAPLLVGQDVAVLGCGIRAAEQALIAEQAGVRHVLVICEDSEPRFGVLAEDVARCGRIEVRTNTRVLGFEKRADGTLRALRLRSAEGDTEAAVAWLFLARGLECDWSLLGGRAPGSVPHLICAGLAAGVPYDDYPALVRDARSATQRVLACTEESAR